MDKTASVVLCVLALLLPCVVSQGGLTWSEIPTDEASRPSPRNGFALGYDPLGNQLILFSGFGGSNDTWIFDIDNDNWREVQVTGPAPAARGFAYYGVVTVGGESLFVVTHGILGKDEFDDVWVFNFTTEEWTEIQPQGSGPGPRYGGHWGADKNVFWMGSGFTETTKPLQTRYIDTYRLIFSSPTEATWDQVYPQPSPGNQFMALSPHGRCLQASAVVPGSGLVFAGGCMRGGRGGGPCPTDDTWFFNQNTSSWSELNRCITPRTFSGMAPLTNDPGLALLYGGDDAFSKQLLHVAGAPYPENEVFVVDVLKGEWKRYSVDSASGDYPERRSRFGMASGSNGNIYMFGGQNLSSGNNLNDLWVISGDISQTEEMGCNNVWFSYAHLHGLLMFLAFGLLFPLGVTIAKAFKCKKSKVWFVFHVIFQLTAALLAIIAFIIIFAVSERAGQTPSHPHAIIGILLMFFMLIQPINGIFRPHIKKDGERTKYRRCWECFHSVYGLFVIILGFVQVTLGVFLIVPPLGVWVTWLVLMSAWWLAYIIYSLGRAIYCCCCSKSCDDDDEHEKHEMK